MKQLLNETTLGDGELGMHLLTKSNTYLVKNNTSRSVVYADSGAAPWGN